MKVSIKDLSVEMEVKNKGVEFDVYSPSGETFHGDPIVSKTGLTWCKGKTSAAKGIKIDWLDFIRWAETQK